MPKCEKILMCNLCKQLRPTGGKYKGCGRYQHHADGDVDWPVAIPLHNYFFFI